MGKDKNLNTNDIKPRFNPLMMISFIIAALGCGVFIESSMEHNQNAILLNLGLLLFMLSILLGVAALIQNARSRGRLMGLSPTEFIVIWVIMILMVDFLFPVLSKGPESIRPITCMDNLKQLGNATLQYTQDYDDSLPPTTNWNKALDPYIKNKKVLICPSAQNPDLPSYAINSGLAGYKHNQIQNPDKVVLMFDSIPGKNLKGGPEILPPQPRHHKGDNISFTDNHVKWWRREEVMKLRWNPVR